MDLQDPDNNNRFNINKSGDQLTIPAAFDIQRHSVSPQQIKEKYI